MKVAPGFFGTKVRIVALVEVGKKPEEKNCEIAVSTSSPRIDQADRKKAEVKPSGPGDLLGFNFLRTFAISAAEGGEDIRYLSCSEQKLECMSCNQA